MASMTRKTAHTSRTTSQRTSRRLSRKSVLKQKVTSVHLVQPKGTPAAIARGERLAEQVRKELAAHDNAALDDVMERKINTATRKPKRVVERNIALMGDLMKFLLADPRLLSSLPNNFELVILPDDDPEMRVYNLKLLDTLANKDKPIVFARLKSSRKASWRKTQPRLLTLLYI